MKTFKTIIITAIITIILMFVLCTATGLIDFQSRKEEHNVQLLVDGQVVSNADYTRALGMDISTNGHIYIGR